MIYIFMDVIDSGYYNIMATTNDDTPVIFDK